MPVSTDHGGQSKRPFSKSKFANLIRQYTHPIGDSMRGLKLRERCKASQVHALSPSDNPTATITGTAPCGKPNCRRRRHHHPEDNLTINSILSNPSNTKSVSAAVRLLPCGLPTTDLLEPPIDPHLRSLRFVETLADLYRRLESSPPSHKSLVCLEQFSFLSSLGNAKLHRRCLQAARQHALDVHSKVVLSAWLRHSRREDEYVGVSPMECSGLILDCPTAALSYGYSPNSAFDHCQCSLGPSGVANTDLSVTNERVILEEESDVCFCIGNEEINCNRYNFSKLSSPLTAMLYGDFLESKQDKIDFSQIGISAEAMRAVEAFSRIRSLGSVSPNIVLEILSFANRFCCEEIKTACDSHLASLVCRVEDAWTLIDYGLEEKGNFLVASCLQVLLRELPRSLSNPKFMETFCSSEARERLAMVGHASFLLYYFLSQVSMEENVTSNSTLMLLERLNECATEKWQKALALHQLGCVLLDRKQYKGAQSCFESAAEFGHVYSVAGVARAKYKQGQMFSAYKLINSLTSEYKSIGWLYQERSLYNIEGKKILDLNTATKLDPTLPFPYEYRAVAMLEENQIRAGILEINKIIGFKVSPNLLSLRAWLLIALEDYEAAVRDVRALLTLEPNYRMFNGKMSGNHLVDLLSQHVQQWSPADCWIQLYDRWSSVDDIGSLAVIHQMLAKDNGNSLLWFRQSLLLLRLNCQKAAMRCLRLARNLSSSNHEKLVYEGWVLYDTGYREEALSKAKESISIQRSFEAFFLKAYILADTTLDHESSSYVVQLLEEALRCPSDSLRKGQALNNLGSIYVNCGELAFAEECYVNALNIKHTRAHQGLARVYHLKNQKKVACDEMTKLIEKAQNNASSYEKRSEYCDHNMANQDLSMATQLDPLRTYPYRYRAAVLMDDRRETEAVEELSKAIGFRPELQMLHLRAAFHESMGNLVSALQDCEAALCLDPSHKDTLSLYNRTQVQAINLPK